MLTISNWPHALCSSDFELLVRLLPELYSTWSNHNNYNFLKSDWCINCCSLLGLICKVVIGQCNWTVGCNWTPVIRQLHEQIILSPLN